MDTLTEIYIEYERRLFDAQPRHTPKIDQTIARNIGEAMLEGSDDEPKD